MPVIHRCFVTDGMNMKETCRKHAAIGFVLYESEWFDERLYVYGHGMMCASNIE